jgi:acetyl-CoA synthetase
VMRHEIRLATIERDGGSGSTQAIESLATEDRIFPPSDAFRAQANVTDPEIYARAAADPEAFWAAEAERLDWFRPWTTVLDWQPPFARWFDGGQLNVAHNCLDRHVANGLGDKVAYYWEGEPGDRKVITYGGLLDEVKRCANALRSLGVEKGDRVAIYLPMISEFPVAVLACARIGAPHTVVFGGFSADSLRDRINDAGAKVVITADGGYRRGKTVALKPQVDAALANDTCPTAQHVFVVRRTGDPVEMTTGRDVWWDDVVPGQSLDCPAEPMESEDLLYLLYTSGTTAKPKGIVHTTGGYLTGVASTFRNVFDIKPDDVYWCAADIGWVTGHSYIVYGPLANGTTGVLYEGAPDFPDPARWWDIVERYSVSVLYTAPTAIRAHMKWGAQFAEKHDLSSLRLLGSVGEPINPEAWVWYHHHVGGDRAPIVDTWWQTETGAIMISPLPGITDLKPGSSTVALPGIDAGIVDEAGEPVGPNQGGYLVINKPWPSMLRGIYGDDARYRDTYWSRFPGRYFPGDGARYDADGYTWLLGRVDDVMNVSGHRLSTTEIESALVSHELVAEAAVVGVSDPISGETPVAFVTLRDGSDVSKEFGETLRQHVATKIGAIARPKTVMFTPDLPKTRSGKIMRRLLRDIAADRPLGDTTTLADAGVVELIRDASRSGKEE